MPIDAEMPLSHPLRAEWERFKETDEFKSIRRWATQEQYVDGSLWGVWLAAYRAATERAASLHESVNPASDAERGSNTPGAGAMGAVIQYRDMIRSQH